MSYTLNSSAEATLALVPKELLTLKEARELLNVSRTTLYRMVRDQQLVCVYPRRRAPRIPRESLLTLLEQSSRQLVA